MYKRFTSIICIVISIIISASVISSAYHASFADTTVDRSFIVGVLYSEPEFKYKISYNVTDAVKPNTGRYDDEKACFITGNSLSSYASGKQIFENGKYGSGNWTSDRNALAKYITEALNIYGKEEKRHSENENKKAREIISYGFEYLSPVSRISVEGSAAWLFDDISGVPQIKGDINGDRKTDASDLALLKDVLIGKYNADLYVCDINGDGLLDHADISSLENYLIYISNKKDELEIPTPSLKVISLGDSIARGYGIGNEGSNGTSLSSYGAILADMLDDLTPYDILFTNYGNDGDRLNDMTEKINSGFKRISSDEPLDKASKDSDIILISIGGNDLLAALRQRLTYLFGSDIDDIGSVFTVISQMNFTNVLAFMSAPDIDEYMKNSSEEFGSAFEAELRTILNNNTDAFVAVTAIPDALSNTDLVFKYDLLGPKNIKIINFYEAAGKWISYYNQEIKNAVDNINSERLIFADVSGIFDGSYDYILMDAPSVVCVNDFAAGSYVPDWTFDIHPSAKGHQLMAETHINAMNGVIGSLNALYDKPTASARNYKYDTDTGVPGISILYSAGNNKAVITIKCEQKVSNIYAVLALSGNLTPSNVKVASPGGNAAFNKDDDHFYVMSESDNISISELSIELLLEGNGKTDIKTDAVIALNTEQGTVRYTASGTETVEILSDTENSTNDTYDHPVTGITTSPDVSAITGKTTNTAKPKTERTAKPYTEKTAKDSKPVTQNPEKSNSENQPGLIISDSGSDESFVSSDMPVPVIDNTDPSLTDTTGKSDKNNESSTLIIGDSKKDPAVYIIIISALLILLAAAVITAVSLIKNKINLNKNKKEGQHHEKT